VVISGAAGVGKSRLAAEACTALATDFTVEWCAATRSSAAIPFGPVARLLASDVGTGRLDDALRGALVAIDQRPGTTVVAVDDAHLLDDASATLVHRLAADGIAQLLLTRRSGEPAPDPIGAIVHDDATRYLELQPLSRAETADLLADVLGEPVEAQTIDRLWTLTGGNLLFLRELVRTLQDEHALALAHGLWRWGGALSTAPRLLDVLHARLDRLEADERDALTILAFAEPLPLPILRELVDGVALASLGRQGLVIVETTSRVSTARLAHPLYAELLRLELSPLEEVEASRRVAEAALRVTDATMPHAHWVSAWALEAGVEMPLDVIVEAAREALRATDAERAGKLARAALARSRSAESARVLGEALLALERYEEEAAAAFADAADLASNDALRARTVRLVANCERAVTPTLRQLGDDPGTRLTPREREIAHLAAGGRSSPAIAEQLVLSVRTVDNHLHRAYSKLGINSRSELAARRAQRRRWVAGLDAKDAGGQKPGSAKGSDSGSVSIASDSTPSSAASPS
jgi:DNA-binding NarL/FixJ family response regulator